MGNIKIYTATPTDLSPPIKGDSFCIDLVLAADYHELEKKYEALAKENVELKGALTGRAYISFIKANGWNVSASTVNGKFVNFADPEVDFGSMVFAYAKKLIETVETPSTDAYHAAIKADGVDSGIKTIMTMLNHQAPGVSDAINVLRVHSSELRQGEK